VHQAHALASVFATAYLHHTTEQLVPGLEVPPEQATLSWNDIKKLIRWAHTNALGAPAWATPASQPILRLPWRPLAANRTESQRLIDMAWVVGEFELPECHAVSVAHCAGPTLMRTRVSVRPRSCL